MTTTTLTGDSYRQTVDGHDMVIVDFWAEWCGPCRQFAPVFEQVSEEFPSVTFGKVDTEAEAELAAREGISAIPTLIAYRKGAQVFRHSGAMPLGALRDLVSRVQSADVKALREQAAIRELTETMRQAQPAATARPSAGRPGVDYPDANGAIV